MHDQGVADIESNAHLCRIEIADDFAQLLEVPSQESVAGRGMVLEQTSEVILLVKSGKLFELGSYLPDLVFEVGLAVDKTDPVELGADFPGSAQDRLCIR